MKIVALLAVSMLVASAASGQEVRRDSTQSPCAEPQYVALKGVPLDSMSEREYAFYLQRDAACTAYDRTVAAVAPQRDAVAKSASVAAWAVLSTLTATITAVILLGL